MCQHARRGRKIIIEVRCRAWSVGAERIFETQKKELSGDGISIRYDIAICKNWQCVWGKFRIFRQFFFCVRKGCGQEAFCLTVKKYKKMENRC